MNFDLNEEQQMWSKAVHDFVAKEVKPKAHEVDENEAFNWDAVRKGGPVGLLGMNIPEQYGGGGLCAIDTMLVEEQFGHTKDILIRRAFGNVYESLLAGDDAQKKRWLLPTVRGERTCSIAFTEPGAGSDAAGIATRAVRDGNLALLRGSVHFSDKGLEHRRPGRDFGDLHARPVLLGHRLEQRSCS